MPRFFFDITDGVRTVDEVGLEFPDAHAARDAAIMTLPEIARDKVRRGRDGSVAVLMRGWDGHAVFTASLSMTAKWLVETA